MKGAFEIFKRDLKNIFKNYGAIIVIMALCILPSLYAWFNIKACAISNKWNKNWSCK